MLTDAETERAVEGIAAALGQPPRATAVEPASGGGAGLCTVSLRSVRSECAFSRATYERRP